MKKKNDPKYGKLCDNSECAACYQGVCCFGHIEIPEDVEPDPDMHCPD